jgi:flavin-dependent dehydrogenase
MSPSVRVAGGGLSGLATALLLARAGRDVEVWDRRVGGGGRFHGGWQVIENGTTEADALEELAGLDLQGFEALAASRATFLDGMGGRHEVASARPFAYFVRRGAGAGSIDAALRRQAIEAGVALHEGQTAPERVDVVATGPRQADGVARELVFASDLPDTVFVLFDPRITPTGYAYLFCLGGHATFGVAQVRRTAGLRGAAREAWRRFRAELGEFEVRDELEGGQYMNFFVPRDLRDGAGRWHAGEAAGVQDFLFGLGNRLALRSAALAAAGVLGQIEPGRFRRTVLAPMRHTVVLRFAYERLGRRGLARFCRAAAGGDFRDFLIRLQRPRAIGRAPAGVVMAAWRERRGCRHGSLCSWCRRSER